VSLKGHKQKAFDKLTSFTSVISGPVTSCVYNYTQANNWGGSTSMRGILHYLYRCSFDEVEEKYFTSKGLLAATML
jgi:hypothetical protein